jgi:hypothetical protein
MKNKENSILNKIGELNSVFKLQIKFKQEILLLNKKITSIENTNQLYQSNFIVSID